MKLLNSQLLLHFELTDPRPRLEALMAGKPLVKGAFGERLFLYDSVVVPTVDLGIVSVLVGWLGAGLLKEMLSAGAMSFVRFKGSLGYVGNGNGLSLFEIYPSKEKPGKPWQNAPIMDMGDAAEQYVNAFCQDLPAKERNDLVSAVVAHTQEISFPDFDKKVAHETYMDALNSPILRAYFGIRSTNLTQLNGVKPNQTRVFSPQRIWNLQNDDEVDFLLGMAAINLELYLAELTGAEDVTFDPSIQRYMVGKAERVVKNTPLAEAFASILELNDLPDLGAAIGNGQMSLETTWKLRQKRRAEQFRKWFHTNVREEPRRASQEYVAAISRPSLTDRMPVKLLRFVITNTLGLIPVIGTLASAVDSFLIDHMLKGYSPKYLIDDLRKELLITR